jgi:hypothetical protein
MDAHLHHPQQGPSCLNLRQTSKIHCNHHVCPFSIPTKISLHDVNESNYLFVDPMDVKSILWFLMHRNIINMQRYWITNVHTYSSHHRDSQVLCVLFSHFLHLVPEQLPEVNTTAVH